MVKASGRKLSGKKSPKINNKVAYTLNSSAMGALEAPSKQTIILFGNPRGGTTMIANVVRSMGVFLGDDLPVNLEDSDFNWDVLTRQNSTWSKAEKLASIRESIGQRNSGYDIWGWKYPRIDAYFHDVESDLVNPMLICVFRDVVASTWRGVVRRNEPPLNSLRGAMAVQANNLNIVEKSGLPALLISYEQAIADPLGLASSLSQFMSFNLSDEQLRLHSKKVNPSLGYKASDV